MDAALEAQLIMAVHLAVTRDSDQLRRWLDDRQPGANRPARGDHDGALHCL